MALATDVPKGSFRLSMLIYDTRYRSLTIQVFVLILFGLFLAWLLNNTAENLATRGKEFNFGFLWQRAGYDIGQQLIPYTNDSTHFRALLVGLINTLVVAVIGCILATILGIVIGVLRLSNNWLVSRLMTVYVEMFRNVPLLLWILLSYVILSEATPQPRDFRVTDEMAAAGEVPAASMILGQTVAVTNRGTNIPAPLVDRPLGELNLGIASVNLTVLAFLLVIAGSVWANRAGGDTVPGIINPRPGELKAAALAAPTADEANKLWTEAAQEMINNKIIIPMVSPDLILAYGPDVKGVRYSACCNLPLAEITN